MWRSFLFSDNSKKLLINPYFLLEIIPYATNKYSICKKYLLLFPKGHIVRFFIAYTYK